MKTGKGFVKSKTAAVVIAVLAVLVIAVVLAFTLKGCRDDAPVQGGAVTEQAGGSDAVVEKEEKEDEDPKSEPEVKTYTVIFQDYDGTVLKTEEVEEGKAAVAPEDPERKYFTFAGWDKPFDKVTSDLTVTATYTTDKTVIYAESVTVDKKTGEAVVNIRILNNPGIMGAVLKLTVDDKAFSLKDSGKTGYPGLTLTAPGSGVSASPYTFLLDAQALSAADKADGILFTVTLKLKAGVAAGKYAVGLSCDNGAVFDENYKDPAVVFENGTVTVE